MAIILRKSSSTCFCRSSAAFFAAAASSAVPQATSDFAEREADVLAARRDYAQDFGRIQEAPCGNADDVRHSMVGNSIHAGLFASLLGLLLYEIDCIEEVPCLADIANGRPMRLTAGSEPIRLVRAFLSYQGHRRGELKLDEGPCRLETRPTWHHIDPLHWNCWGTNLWGNPHSEFTNNVL